MDPRACGSGTFKHIVQSGETLSDLAGIYETPIDGIRAANPGVSPNNLTIGDTLCIPGDPPSGRDAEYWRRRNEFERRREEFERRRREEEERRRREEFERRRREEEERRRRFGPGPGPGHRPF